MLFLTSPNVEMCHIQNKDGDDRHFVRKEIHISGTVGGISIKFVMQMNKIIPEHDEHAILNASPRVIENRYVSLAENWGYFIVIPDNKADLTKFLSQELIKQACT